MKGFKNNLTEDDLYGPLRAHESQYLGNRLKKAWDTEENFHRTPSLRKIIIKVYGKEFTFYAFFMLIQEFVVKMGQPLLVGKLMEYYTPNQTTITLEQAYYYASGIIILSFINNMIQHSCFFGMQHLSLKMQIGCRSLIYRKALKLSKNAMVESTVGQMVNLISNDVSRFHYLCLHLHQIFTAPIQTIVVMYLLFATLSPSAIVGIGLLLVFIPVQFYMGKLTSFYRFRTAVKTDQRIRLMNEIISGIQVIKMYTWEKPFSKLVELARKWEIQEIKSNSYVRAVYVAITMFLIRTSVFLCVLTYILTGNVLQAQFVYVVTSFYGTLRQPLTIHLPRCIAMLAEINVSLKRIQTFLLNEEVNLDINCNINGKGTATTNNIGITMTDVCVKWTPSSSDYILSNVSFSVGPQQLVAVVGPVGSGKTTLLHVILKEILLLKGSLDVGGSISYASQEPWLFSSSIRQNILFGQKMDAKKYQQIVKVCQLERDFSMMPYGDRTIVGERGVILSGGQKARVSLARAIYKDADIYLLDDPLSAVDAHVGKQLFDDCIAGYLKNKCTVLITHQIQYLSNVDKIFLLENGRINSSGTYTELRNSRSDFIKLLDEEDDSETEEEVILVGTRKRKSTLKETDKLPIEIKEHRSVGTVSKKVYLNYFRTGGNYLLPSFVLIAFILTQIAVSGVDYFLAFWVNLEQERMEKGYNETSADAFGDLLFTSNNLLYVYTSFIVFLIFMALVRSFSFVTFCMTASRHLHDNMFDKIVHATMRFFHTNPTGRVLNRFSRDMGIIDESMPVSLMYSIQVLMNVVAITIVLSLVNYWIIIPTVIIFGIFYCYKIVYLATSRDLKRIESTARSPMFSHLTASLQGLSTIRAFGAQEILQLEFDHHQDLHSSAYFMYMSCSRTFAFWLDMNCIIYIGIVILSFLFIGTETYGGNVGLAITQSISLTGMLQGGIRQWSDLENEMTSVERVMEYTELPSEPDDGRKRPAKDWPSEGDVEFSSVSMKYSIENPYVLKNLNFQIKSQEKIGIVGRTGAGKSSLISALFRLAPVEGKVLIDGVDTKEISLQDLRSKISIIPQEPVLFSGTLRKNLDPFDDYSDDQLWNALEEVELRKSISELASGLSSNVAEGGSNFSVGEKQLLCLARAIVRNNKILVLDEATANVDPQTDELIQKTIRKKFGDCTVLTIAHRLHTVMDSDKILVLDAGRMVEFDHPHVLLEDVEGMFYGLVKQTGKAMAENLAKIANEGYNRMNENKNWALPLFVKGFKRDLTEDDLYGPLKTHESKRLGDKLERTWIKEANLHRNPSLWRSLTKVYGVEIGLYGIVLLVQELIIKMAHPLLIGRLMAYYDPKQTEVTKEMAYLYACGIIGISLLNVLIMHSYFFALQHLGMRVRVACCSLIYRKALRLSKSAMVETTVGQMVNLMSNDVNRFDFLVLHLHHLFVAPIEAIVIIYLLYTTVHPAAMAGAALLLAFVPLQCKCPKSVLEDLFTVSVLVYIGKKTSFYRFRTAVKTDQRVRLMNEIITGIQVIKMYTWEKPFAKLVELARKFEIHQIRAASYLRAVNVSFIIFLNRTSIYLCVLTYVLTGNILNAEYVYVITSFYSILRQSLTMFLPRGITMLAETNVSVKRLQKFLLYDEINTEEDKKIHDNIKKKSKEANGSIELAESIPSKNIGVYMDDVCVKWTSSSPDNTLSNINFNVGPQQLVAIVGPVGSGKTTLLHVILKELPLLKGYLDVGGKISYAAQEPWLFAASIRQNILFGEKLDAKRYQEVVKVCSLERDFSLFPYGDRTMVGERGVMLSGGQKARINLARAVYKDADIYLLDDPLSAVDTHVGKQLFDNCITDYLKDKCTVLVTHQLQYLSNVNRIYLLEDGSVSASGTYTELRNSGGEFVKLLEEENIMEHEEEKKIAEVKKLKSLKSLEKGDKPVEIKEHRSTGTLSKKIYLRYLKAGGNYLLSVLVLLLFIFAQMGGSGADLFVTFWVNLEQSRLEREINDSKLNETTIEEDRISSFFNADNCIYVYSSIICFLIIITVTRSLSFFKICMRASKNLHNNMFSNIVYTSMRFFNTNPSGRILNRFSKDMGSIDETLPMSITDTIQREVQFSLISPLLCKDSPRSELLVPKIHCEQNSTITKTFTVQPIICFRTFAFWLDMNCIIYIGFVILSFLFLGTETYGGNVGLAITQSITLTGMLQWGMRQWSELENQMTSVERVIEYTELESEPDVPKRLPPASWPTEGKIDFQALFLQYSSEDPFVLKNLTFTINPKEKIGIVGRTGAGKSSLISALFRLAPIDGSIVIDDVDTKDISLNSLRSKISIIPQEPVLFSGTLRKNLDPFDEYDDDQLWNALEEVKLKTVVSELPSGLTSNVSEGGSNFSVGQRQLLCLARAVVRSNKILILDEATANVDPQTDELIQTTIRRKFEDCTVLTIAHRLHTVMDSDKILVMDAGRAVEFDHPHILLENTEGVFYGLVKQAGKGMAEHLIKIAS
ncbi:ABC tran and/or MMR HSR1 domain containing protein, partial [Asbolus verrucosus]